MRRTFSSTQACQLGGVSYRQLDYWARTGRLGADLAACVGSGKQRCWTEQDVILVQIVSRLRARGLSLDRAFDAAAAVLPMMTPGEPIIPAGFLFVPQTGEPVWIADEGDAAAELGVARAYSPGPFMLLNLAAVVSIEDPAEERIAV